MTDQADTGGHRPTREALENLTETVPALVYIAEMGEHGFWHYISPQIRDVLGYEPEEWRSDRTLWYRSIHPDDIDMVMADEDHTPTSTEVMPSIEYRLRARDGRWVWVYECARLVVDPEGGPTLWHGVISDISALKDAEGSAARKAEQQALTARLGVAIFKVRDEQELIELATGTLLGLEDMIEAEIWQHVDGGQVTLRHRSNYDGPPLTLPFEPDRFPGAELDRGETVVIADWDRDERMRPYARYRNPEVASTMLVPITGIEGQFGFLAMNASVAHRFSRQDEDFLLAAASLLGSTIDRNRVEASMRHRLLHDSLTELPNREMFTQQLERAVSDSASSGVPMATLFLDIDHFKLINDGIGHHVGDETLKEVGNRLLRALGDEHTVARFGGDEFGIVIGSVERAEEVIEVAEMLLGLLDEPIRFEGGEIVVAASIGVALFDPEVEPDKPADLLLREANAAMHDAKNLGRAQVRVFDQPLRNSALDRLNVERGLRLAIDGGELMLHYQPVVSLPDYRIVGFEALVRWNHPERGTIQPEEFIPVAEESGLISRIDGWALEEVVRQIVEWEPLIPVAESFGVSVNASSRQLHRSHLPAEIEDLLNRHSMPPDRLAIEITEGTLMAGPGTVKTVLRQIHSLGVRLALDDFGTGFSSLSHLSQFPFDVIKIDRSFIEQLGTRSPAGPAITDAILRIGRALSMTVIAEGVSTRAELDLVSDLGCRVVQGFLISRPVSASTATEMLRASRLEVPDAA